MTNKEVKREALTLLWHWGVYLSDPYDDKLSETLQENSDDGHYTEEDALRIQKQLQHETELIWNKVLRLDKLR